MAKITASRAVVGGSNPSGPMVIFGTTYNITTFKNPKTILNLTLIEGKEFCDSLRKK